MPLTATVGYADADGSGAIGAIVEIEMLFAPNETIVPTMIAVVLSGGKRFAICSACAVEAPAETSPMLAGRGNVCVIGAGVTTVEVSIENGPAGGGCGYPGAGVIAASEGGAEEPDDDVFWLIDDGDELDPPQAAKTATTTIRNDVNATVRNASMDDLQEMSRKHMLLGGASIKRLGAETYVVLGRGRGTVLSQLQCVCVKPERHAGIADPVQRRAHADRIRGPANAGEIDLGIDVERPRLDERDGVARKNASAASTSARSSVTPGCVSRFNDTRKPARSCKRVFSSATAGNRNRISI
jgi:hypothetical protein